LKPRKWKDGPRRFRNGKRERRRVEGNLTKTIEIVGGYRGKSVSKEQGKKAKGETRAVDQLKGSEKKTTKKSRGKEESAQDTTEENL